MFSRYQSGQNPARKADFRPGSTIAQHRVDLYLSGFASAATVWVLRVGSRVGVERSCGVERSVEGGRGLEARRGEEAWGG